MKINELLISAVSFSFEALDVHREIEMSSSQQEILFFETIAHDGEIDQVNSKHLMASVRICLNFIR